MKANNRCLEAKNKRAKERKKNSEWGGLGWESQLGAEEGTQSAGKRGDR